MRPSPILLAMLAVVGLVGAATLAWDIARPRIHPIKVADARKYGTEARTGRPTAPNGAAASAPNGDNRTDLFGLARVVDGDTLEIGGVRAKLWTIGAPELAQTCVGEGGKPWACGEASRRHLQTLVAGRTVACRPEGPPPQDGGWLGLCFVAEAPCQDASVPCVSDLSSLNLAQVASGWATDLEGQYSEPQADARELRAGVWAGGAVAPSP